MEDDEMLYSVGPLKYENQIIFIRDRSSFFCYLEKIDLNILHFQVLILQWNYPNPLD